MVIQTKNYLAIVSKYILLHLGLLQSKVYYQVILFKTFILLVLHLHLVDLTRHSSIKVGRFIQPSLSYLVFFSFHWYIIALLFVVRDHQILIQSYQKHSSHQPCLAHIGLTQLNTNSIIKVKSFCNLDSCSITIAYIRMLNC